MVTHMKTTIEIATPVLEEAKRLARQEGVTLRVLVEEGLRTVVAARGSRQRFRLKDAGCDGKGVQPGVEEGRWSDVRDLIYQGRGA
jgi:hypothetical protein